MSDRKKPTDAEIREAFGDKVQIEARPMTEERIRAIVREELAAAAKDAKPLEYVAWPASNATGWQHDADHGSIQARRDAQRTRDEAAGINSNKD